MNCRCDRCLDKTVSIGLVTYAKALHNHDFVVGAYGIRPSNIIGWNWDFKGRKHCAPTDILLCNSLSVQLPLEYRAASHGHLSQ